MRNSKRGSIRIPDSGIAATRALTKSVRTPFWLDSPESPAARPGLFGDRRADLVVVGGGFTGLWTALRAAEREPGREIVLLEADRLSSAASGRNGGFVESSVTHGLENGLRHFPNEIAALESLGAANLDAIESTIADEQLDCAFVRPGAYSVATASWHVTALVESGQIARDHGLEIELLEGSSMRAQVRSPTYLGGLRVSGRSSALVDPARLAWGLAEVIERRGATIHERTRALAITENRVGGVDVITPDGVVSGGQVVLATSAFPPLVKKIRRYVLPVYDYVLVTEPLNATTLGEIGWRGREGISDLGNQFHYYRLTEDDRILFGGYDAIYHYNNGVRPELEVRRDTFELLAGHFFTTFPQCEGVEFTHAWGGAIDTCSRFCAYFDTALAGRVAYAAGFTGLGVGASRFAADVLLDLLGGTSTERTELEMVRTKPFPFPPEPLRSIVVGATRRSLIRADERDGQRNLWLHLLDAMGVGFDS